tara:strand:- start:71 stop:619 length:549 start_codon:yes stop_codon:yes gene_type:complete
MSKQTPRHQSKKTHKGRKNFSSKDRHKQQHHSKSKKKSKRISDHFNKKDFLCEESKSLRISLGLIGALELLRTQSKNRITIHKGYESPEVHEKKGGFKKSYHTMGLAANITIDNMSLEETFKLAEGIDEIKGLGINYALGHVHVDTRKEDERLLWVVTASAEYVELTDDKKADYIDGYNDLS